MPTVKSVPASGTARQRLERKKALEEENGMTADQEAELNRARQAAQLHKESGQIIVDISKQQPKDMPEFPETAGAPVIAEVAAPQAASAVMPVSEKAIPKTLPDMMIEITKPFKFKIAGGRIVVMAPPSIPFELTMGPMFKDKKEYDLESKTQMQAAKIMNYVRSLDGAQQPAFLTEWNQVVTLMHSLGSLGVRAVYDVYGERWPDSGETLWEPVGNS